MITVQPETKVFRSANFQESKFGIQASAKAFNILSSGLYADKYAAIVRELCTNASDAHAAAGKPDLPIKVTCPSAFNMSFMVEDFGNGIDPDEFENIYTTYFYSTKTNTNDQVGCFGLGSKSPFAYTDQFTVENCYGGNKYVYSCYKTKDGQPAVALVSKVTTDKTGLKVFFPVKHGDVYAFQSAMIRVLSLFDVKPETNIYFDTVAKKDKVFSLSSSSTCGLTSGGCYVRMGQVIYPVPSNYFTNIFENYRSRSTIINVNIGDVDITPSRESIEITSHTEQTLQKLREEVRQYFIDGMKSIENDSSLSKFAKHKAKRDYVSDNGLNGQFVQVDHVYCVLDNSVVPYDCYKKYSYRSSVHSVSWETRVYPGAILVLNDVKRGLKTRLTEYLTNNRSDSQAFVFDIKDKDAAMKEYELEDSDFVLVSSMPSPASVATTRNKTNCTRIYGNSYNWDRSGYFLDKSVTNGVYVRDVEAFKINYNKLRFFKELENEGVMVFTENQMKVLKIENRQFVHLYDFLKSKIDGAQEEFYYAMYSNGAFDRKETVEKLLTLADKLPNSNLFVKLKSKFDSRSLDASELSLLSIARDMMYQLDSQKVAQDIECVNTKLGKASKEFNELVEEMKEKYPLLNNLLANCELSDIIDGVVEYVNLIDAKGQN